MSQNRGASSRLMGATACTVLRALLDSTSTELDVTLLEQLREFLTPSCFRPSQSDDDCEREWLQRGIEKVENRGIEEVENPFPSALPSELFSLQLDLNHFTFYVFERRYGRTEFLISSSTDENLESLDGVYALPTSPRVPDDCRLLVRLNELLGEHLRWFLCQPLTVEVLESLKYAVAQAHSMPVVRNHTCVHVMQWLKTRSDNGFSDQVFPLVKALIVSGITDVWSAIRNSCVARLAHSLDYFTLDQAHNFYIELIQICQAKESSWQAIEGAVMGMTTLVRRFSWTDVIQQQLNNNTKEEISEYMLKFGSSEQSSLPKFITDSVHSVLYSLLAHSQLSIRDQATNAFSSILSRCEFQEAFFAFQEVIHRLCKGIMDVPESQGSTVLLLHVAVLRPDFKFLKAYEAEGLLGVCVFLIKHIPPGYLLTTWPLYFSTFNLYLMHPASTVRQATSAVFKYLVAKECSSPILLKLVLQGLAADWQIDTDLLTCDLQSRATTSGEHTDSCRVSTPECRHGATTPEYRHGTTTLECRHGATTPEYRHGATTPECRHGATTPECRHGATTLEYRHGTASTVTSLPDTSSDHQNCQSDKQSQSSIHIPLHKQQRISIRNVQKLLDEHPSKTAGCHRVSQSWEWREGRLLAYELILKFLIANHIHYVFPTFALSRSSASASGSVDENLISKQGRPRAWTDESLEPKDLNCNHSHEGEARHLHKPRRQSDVSPPSGQHLKSNSFAAISCQMSSYNPMTIKEDESVYIEAASELCYSHQNPSQMREAWSRQAKRAASFSIADDDTTRTRKLIRQYSVTCQKYPKRPFRPPKSQGLSLANSLLCQAADLEMDTSNNLKTAIIVSGPVYKIVQPLSSPLGKIDQQNSNFFKYKEMKSKTSSKTSEDLPEWASNLELENLTCILTQILFQNIECLADTRWELRRMGQQLLPLVAETLRWFNMAPLAYLWDNHLTRENTLLCYGGCIALKNSISHAGRLRYYLDQPPSTWKDPESCSKVALYIVNEIKRGIKNWLCKVQSIVQYPGYDRLTVVAIETIMLSHLSFHSSLDIEQKLEAENQILVVLLSVFRSSFPDKPLSIALKPFCREQNAGFLVPVDGFLSCSTRIESSAKNAQQFGKQFFSEAHSTFKSFLKTCQVHKLVVIFPVLIHYIEWFSEETALCHSLMDGLTHILTKTRELLKSTENRQELHALVQTYFDFGLTAVSDAVRSAKVLDIAILRQLLDLILKACEFIEQPSLSQIFKAISQKLDYEPDLLRLLSDDTTSRTNTPDLYIFTNDIPTSPVDEPAIPVEEEDDEPVDSLGVLRESEALDASHGSSGGRGPVRLDHQEDDESDMSDWDSWEEEEEDQSALIAVFADFLRNLQNIYESKSDQESSIFKKQLKKCSRLERQAIASVMLS